MRRIPVALLALMLAAAAAPQLLAQAQDPLIVSARQFSQQGNHDTAIAMLRSGLASRPNDEALKQELAGVLTLKEQALSRKIAELRREIAALRGPLPAASTAGCGVALPVRVGGNIRTPIKVHDVKPVYPAEAMAAGIQGIVIVEGRIDCDGNIADVRVLRGMPMLSDAAVGAVKQWKYRPTLLNGVPIPVVMTMTVTFSLRE